MRDSVRTAHCISLLRDLIETGATIKLRRSPERVVYCVPFSAAEMAACTFEILAVSRGVAAQLLREHLATLQTADRLGCSEVEVVTSLAPPTDVQSDVALIASDKWFPRQS